MKDVFVFKIIKLAVLYCSFVMVCIFGSPIAASASEVTPQSSRASSTVEITGRWNQGPVFASAVSGNYLYFGSSGTVRVVAVEKDGSGNAVAWEEVASIQTDGVVRDMILRDDYLYIADGSGWLRLVNIKNPRKPKLSGKLELDSEIKAIHIENDRVYIAAGWKGIHMIDVSKPHKPELIDSFPSKGYSLDLVVKEGIAYVAAGHDAGLQISDLSNPSKPKALGSHPIAGSASGIDTNGRHVFVVNMDDHEPSLSIFDVSDKDNPTQVAAEPLEYGAERVRIDGNLAYVAGVANDAGLIVIDIADPANPKKLGAWWDSTCSESVTIDNQIAYLAHGDQGLEVLDVRKPDELTVIKHFSAAGHVRGIDTLFVSPFY